MDGFKLTYSGDTRPNKKYFYSFCWNIFFIEISKISSFISCSEKANIMIPEATFSDDLQENAI